MSPAFLDYCRLIVQMAIAEIIRDGDLSGLVIEHETERPGEHLNDIERHWLTGLMNELALLTGRMTE
jgi:hypothetical protein